MSKEEWIEHNGHWVDGPAVVSRIRLRSGEELGYETSSLQHGLTHYWPWAKTTIQTPIDIIAYQVKEPAAAEPVKESFTGDRAGQSIADMVQGSVFREHFESQPSSVKSPIPPSADTGMEISGRSLMAKIEPTIADAIAAAEERGGSAARVRIVKLENALQTIQHSMRQALIPGNDKRREIELSLNVTIDALAAIATAAKGGE